METIPNNIGSHITFVHDDSLRGLSGFNPVVFFGNYILYQTFLTVLLLLTLSWKLISLKQCFLRGLFHSLTMDVGLSFSHVEKIRGGAQRCMMESEDFISNINFIFKNEKKNLIYFNSQSIGFSLSTKKIQNFRSR